MGQSEPIVNGDKVPVQAEPSVLPVEEEVSVEAAIPGEGVKDTPEVVALSTGPDVVIDKTSTQEENVDEELGDPIDLTPIPMRFTDEERDEILDGFKVVMAGHVESRCTLIKDFPRAQAHMKQVGDAMYQMVEDFLVKGKVPRSARPSDEEIDNSLAPNKPFQAQSHRKRPGE